MLRVGRSKILKGDKEKTLDYSMVKTDSKGFADAREFIPVEYDLVVLITDRKRRVIGWWTGHEFYSRNLIADEKVCLWKKLKETY